MRRSIASRRSCRGARPTTSAKISPVEASASYLAHVRAAWNQRFPDAPLEHQDVVLTVPASFDEGARALTVEAARMAGCRRCACSKNRRPRSTTGCSTIASTLASELRAHASRAGLRRRRRHHRPHADRSRACRTASRNSTRIGVGNHLMLGGDNMDLALAHLVEARLAGQAANARAVGRRSLSQLVERCRAAKEQLLGADAPDSTSITLLGAGSKLIGGARSAQVTREEVEQIIVDGFFPAVASNERPGARAAAIVEFGLPYASDPAVTRHIAAFLRSTRRSRGRRWRCLNPANHRIAEAPLPVPDTLLLNGGVFRAEALTAAPAATLGTWRGEPLQRAAQRQSRCRGRARRGRLCARARGPRAENRRRLAAQLLPRARRDDGKQARTRHLPAAARHRRRPRDPARRTAPSRCASATGALSPGVVDRGHRVSARANLPIFRSGGRLRAPAADRHRRAAAGREQRARDRRCSSRPR